MTNLTGKTAIITGAGAGIGRSIAITFANCGAQVVIADINLAGANAVVAEIEALGGEALASETNVADPAQAASLVATTIERFGKIDILVNNAGLPSQYREGSPEHIWNLGIEQTLSSVQVMSMAAMDQLTANNNGAIVNICSIAGNKIGTDVAWYSAAKAGVSGLTKHQAAIFGPRGLRSNSLCLGLINTPRTAFIKDNPQTLAKFLDRLPVGRIGEADDVGPAAAFLASDDAGFITGTQLLVDGGMTVMGVK
jgi:NAD(P)-dependent dehydrogenase (short-subunit alcohol dehydrogenase family)